LTEHITPGELLQQAELIYSAVEVETALQRLAVSIAHSLAESEPLVLCVMSGAAVFAGRLLPQLRFPLEFDYVQANRYHNRTHGDEIIWKVMPGNNMQGRTVLVLDDILDEGITLAAVREKCLQAGASRVFTAVLTEKDNGQQKPIRADFVGLALPNRYVFGCGMDVRGWWRNLPEIYALR
jgi:hypoxanthine phosphoribosyltransferase